MDPLDRAAALEDCAIRWVQDARKYKGRRREWRLRRANRLRTLAWNLIS